MKSYIAAAIILAASSEALVARRSICCTSLDIVGGSPNGTLGQLGDGQNRVGDDSLPAGTYCFNNGGFTDENGRGCILTPPTSQFQCDIGATPTGGFVIGCDGTVTENGSSDFYICPTGDNGGYNVYKTPVAGQQGCEKVMLNAESCRAPCAPACPSPTPMPPMQKTCPAALTGDWQFPHWISNLDSTMPNAMPGTSYFGEVSSTITSIFDFDIPSSDAGKTCSLIFLFPKQADLQTSSFTFSGSGNIDFSMLKAPADASTSYANMPAVAMDYGVTMVAPGNSYTIASFDCPAGQKIAFEMSAKDDTMLKYFQDYNPSPIGLYISTC